eukprot:5098990-Prymnesium_polylepis.4
MLRMWGDSTPGLTPSVVVGRGGVRRRGAKPKRTTGGSRCCAGRVRISTGRDYGCAHVGWGHTRSTTPSPTKNWNARAQRRQWSALS